MKALIRILLLSCFLFASMYFYGQDCKAMIINAISSKNITIDKFCILDFSVKTTQKESNNNKPSVSEEKIVLTMNSERRILKSSKIEIYEDSHDKFVIMPDSKKIYRFDSNTSIIKQKKKNNYLFFMDSLIYNMNVVSCIDEGSGIKKIILSPNEKIKHAFGLLSLSYRINSNNQNVLWSKADYNGTVSGIFSIEYTFNKWMTLSDTKILPVKEYFFSGTRLLNTYQGYTYKDKRSKKG